MYTYIYINILPDLPDLQEKSPHFKHKNRVRPKSCDGGLTQQYIHMHDQRVHAFVHTNMYNMYNFLIRTTCKSNGVPQQPVPCQVIPFLMVFQL